MKEDSLVCLQIIIVSNHFTQPLQTHIHTYIHIHTFTHTYTSPLLSTVSTHSIHAAGSGTIWLPRETLKASVPWTSFDLPH